ncbi:putative UbiX-like flavin prenyltransferase [Mycolicibacterium litorale]|uniref:Flavin prenyltransferase UbiX n=1 Tax=Mycolicibacterium litorale TaxID=758802 RepID=A0A6S6P1E2_9MYCO|nr:UbiX family flavin prenyltransferase [Mycolicibacterium litorale]BCI51796.1 putative UbiX-like flavin prenyltransferase [Mycolicibacterium litorale]
MTRRIIVGITGASGSILGIRALERLREFEVETHLIISAWGARTLEHESGWTVEEVRRLADVVHKPGDLGATVSSGSFRTDGMLIAPCSMKTVAAIAHGYTEDLVARAADVILKERRRLVLMAREAPLSEVHLENLLKLARMGVSIVPPMPAFYNRPKTLEDVVDHIVVRALDQFDLVAEDAPRWDGHVTKQRP